MASKKPPIDGAPPDELPPPARPPRLTVAPIAAESLEAGRPYAAAAVPPLASATSGTPGVTQWRVWKDVEGARTYLGVIASHATPEALIAKFPAAMPHPGQNGLYIMRGLSPAGVETGQPLAFTISGESPEVHRARASLAAPAAAAAPAAGIELLAAELRKEHQRQVEALAIERRTLADERLAIHTERTAALKAEMELKILQLREEAKIAREAEAERRKSDREEAESKARIEREERDRREKADREERDRREAIAREDRERKDKIEREERESTRVREREHQERMAKLAEKSSLEGLLTTGATLLGTLGLKDKLIERFFGDGDEAPPVTDVTSAIAAVGTALVTQIGTIINTQIAIQAGHAPPAVAAAPAAAAPAPAAAPRIEMRAPAPAPAAAGPKAPAATPPNPALSGMAMPLQRKARTAMRELVAELADAPEAEYQARALAAIAKTPALLPYVKAIGVKAACIEAGIGEEDATKIAAAVPAGMLT